MFFFYHLYKYFTFTSKEIKISQHRSIDSKGILKQSESENAPNRQEETGSNSNQVSLAILQERVAIFFIYFTYLILTNFYLDYKYMGLLNVLNVQYKLRNPKRAVERTPFLKKIAACQSVCV